MSSYHQPETAVDPAVAANRDAIEVARPMANVSANLQFIGLTYIVITVVSLLVVFVPAVVQIMQESVLAPAKQAEFVAIMVGMLGFNVLFSMIWLWMSYLLWRSGRLLDRGFRETSPEKVQEAFRCLGSFARIVGILTALFIGLTVLWIFGAVLLGFLISGMR